MSQTKLSNAPEVIVFNVINTALSYIVNNYRAQSDVNNSYLRQVLYGNALERYDFITQAEEIFLAEPDDPRKISVNMMFNMQKEGVPAIHIMLPSEGTQNGGNGVGMDVGYQGPLFTDFQFDGSGAVTVHGTQTDVFTRRFQSTFNIVITSDNSNEVVLIYHTLKSLLISLSPIMHLMGLENVAIGGNDLQLRSDLVPKSIFMRSINLSLQYETSVPNVTSDPMFLDLVAKGVPIPGN